MKRNKDFLLTMVLAIKVIVYIQKETPVSESLFKKVTGLSLQLLKIRLWHRCLPVNCAKYLRTPFLTEQLRWLLLFTLT